MSPLCTAAAHCSIKARICFVSFAADSLRRSDPDEHRDRALHRAPLELPGGGDH
jgi:hypothetical protein